MGKNNIQHLCKNIFTELNYECEKSQIGLLYKTIQVIVGEKESQTLKQTKEICRYFGIKRDANVDEDKKIIEYLQDAILRDNQLSISLAKLVTNVQGGNMEWIFVASAFTLVGMFLYKESLDKKQPQPRRNNLAVEVTKQQLTSQTIISAHLCLVVPASIASEFRNGQNVNTDKITYLIDSASYFICHDPEKPLFDEKDLTIMKDEAILSDSKREVYIRIKITNGGKMINQKMPYYLKTNLPENVQGNVEELACLKNLSGLEKFHLV